MKEETIKLSTVRGRLLNYFHNKYFGSTSSTEQETMCFVKAVIEQEVMALFGITNEIEERKGKEFVKMLRRLAKAALPTATSKE